jgi:arsenate reductase
MGTPRVLFLCTGNSARSQMAEGFLRHYAGDRYEIHSAGLEPRPVNPLAIQAMSEVGIDISGQRSKAVADYLGIVHFGYLITVCTDAERQCPIFPGVSIRLHWAFDDPAVAEGTEEERLEVFRRVRDEIDARIRVWLVEQGDESGSGS